MKNNSTPPALVRPAPASVLRFAEQVEAGVRKSRRDKLACGKITAAEAARDIALAEELHRWAKAQFLGDCPFS